jgi:antitoxin (DNA-binding transcriptional repressor) of toxin-antitoxin stability system
LKQVLAPDGRLPGNPILNETNQTRVEIMKAVNITEANFSKLLKMIGAGEPLIIARAGKPVAQIMPYSDKPKRRIGFLKGSSKFRMTSTRCSRKKSKRCCMAMTRHCLNSETAKRESP